MAPAFDLTQAVGTWEHATSVNGKGQNITPDDMLALAIKTGISERHANEIIAEVRSRLDKIKS